VQPEGSGEQLLELNEVTSRLLKAEFKPNTALGTSLPRFINRFAAYCGAVLIDLFIRLGHLTPDNEPDYVEIVTRLHGRFDFERW